jgi:hypothetical protein
MQVASGLAGERNVALQQDMIWTHRKMGHCLAAGTLMIEHRGETTHFTVSRCGPACRTMAGGNVQAAQVTTQQICDLVPTDTISRTMQAHLIFI